MTATKLLFSRRPGIYLLFLLLAPIGCGGESSHQQNPMGTTEQARPEATTTAVKLTDDQAIKILRDSCQRCHDNLRVDRVKQNEITIPPLVRSANFNMQALKDKDFEKPQVREKILAAIEKNMPVSVFVSDKSQITKEKFLSSPEGLGLLQWLKQLPPTKGQ